MVLHRAIGVTAEAPEEADRPYSRWTRMLIILGGSALLWVLIGSFGVSRS